MSVPVTSASVRTQPVSGHTVILNVPSNVPSVPTRARAAAEATRRTLTLVALLAALAPAPAAGRDCPSKLPAHLWSVTDSLSIGAELRAFYLGVDVGGGLPISDTDPGWDNNFLTGLRMSLFWQPLDVLSLTWEGEGRYRRPGWESSAVPGFSGRLWQLYLTYSDDPVEASAGLQMLVFGMSAIFDNRFLSARVQYATKTWVASAFGGATSADMERNANHCLWIRYSSLGVGWRTLSKQLNNAMGGATFSLKTLRPWRAQALYLYSGPDNQDMRSHALSLSIGGPVLPQRISLELEPFLIRQNTGDIFPGFAGEVRMHIPVAERPPVVRLGMATGFNYSDGARPSPVYENLSWGYLKRYSIYDGHLFMARADWDPIDLVRPTIRYYLQSFNFTKEMSSDELDAGLEFHFGELYYLVLSYVGMNFMGPYEPSHGLYLEARVILGE